MPSKAARHLATQASNAENPASRFAAMVKLEAVEPEGKLADPELVLLAADHLEGDKLAVELANAEDEVRHLAPEP